MGEAPTSLKDMAAQVVASASGAIMAPHAPQPPSGNTSSDEEVFKVDPSEGTNLKHLKCKCSPIGIVNCI